MRTMSSSVILKSLPEKVYVCSSPFRPKGRGSYIRTEAGATIEPQVKPVLILDMALLSLTIDCSSLGPHAPYQSKVDPMVP